MLPVHRTRAAVFNYDEIPAGYYYEVMRSGAATQRFWHQEKFREVARRIDDGSRVLDLGCGPGSFLSILGETRPRTHAIGVDVASLQTDFAAREVGSKFADGRIRFQVIPPSPEKLPFESGSFDVVTCIEVIEHLHPYLAMQMMLEARRVLKPGGRLIVTTPNYRSLWPLIEFALEKLSPVKYHEQHISKFTPNALVKFVESAGFGVTRLQTIFIIAPFLASISDALARALHGIERVLPVHLGSLLVAECTLVDPK